MTTPRSTQRSCSQPWPEATLSPAPSQAATPLLPEAKQCGVGLHTQQLGDLGAPPPTLRTTPPLPSKGRDTPPRVTSRRSSHSTPSSFFFFFRPLNPAFPDSGKNREEKAEGSEAPSDKYYGPVPPL